MPMPGTQNSSTPTTPNREPPRSAPTRWARGRRRPGGARAGSGARPSARRRRSAPPGPKRPPRRTTRRTSAPGRPRGLSRARDRSGVRARAAVAGWARLSRPGRRGDALGAGAGPGKAAERPWTGHFTSPIGSSGTGLRTTLSTRRNRCSRNSETGASDAGRHDGHASPARVARKRARAAGAG